MISALLPMKIESLANLREHWTTRAIRAKAQRQAAYFTLKTQGGFSFPVVVTLTRIAPRELDDDNLAGGFKHVRDGVADFLGVKDNDKRITWRYAQARGDVGQYAASITVESV